MYERNTMIPVFRSEAANEITWDSIADEEAYDKLHETNSICDVIFEFGGDGQANEVMEHVLHAVSNVGLHYTFYDTWGVHRDSMMNE